MPLKKVTKDKSSAKTDINLTDVANQHLQITVFGKVVNGVDPSKAEGALVHPTGDSDSLHLGQVYGYFQNHECIRLKKPALVLLPKPSGPANACGWSADEYVMWQVPADWNTLLLHPISGSFASVVRQHSNLSKLTSSALESQQSLEDWQCDHVVDGCVRRITQSARPYNRGESLQQFGVNSDVQCRGIADLIVYDQALGVGQYSFKLNESAIQDLAPSWTMGQLANRIKDKAVPI